MHKILILKIYTIIIMVIKGLSQLGYRVAAHPAQLSIKRPLKIYLVCGPPISHPIIGYSQPSLLPSTANRENLSTLKVSLLETYSPKECRWLVGHDSKLVKKKKNLMGPMILLIGLHEIPESGSSERGAAVSEEGTGGDYSNFLAKFELLLL